MTTSPDYLASLLNDESAALRRAGQMMQDAAARLQAKFDAEDEARGWPKSKAILFTAHTDMEPRAESLPRFPDLTRVATQVRRLSVPEFAGCWEAAEAEYDILTGARAE